MAATTIVDLHLHSNLSDGTLGPEELARAVARRRVAVAALTDHDTVEGLPAFRRTLGQRGIGFIPGVEITTWLDGQEIHILAYAVDETCQELVSTIAAARPVETNAVLLDPGQPGTETRPDAPSAVPGRGIGTIEAIALVHRNGGQTFLAHPLTQSYTPEVLGEIVKRLTDAGLDGLEVFYGEYSATQREHLLSLAQQYHLLASAGSDYHGGGQSQIGVKMPNDPCQALLDRVSQSSTVSPGVSASLRQRRGRRRFFHHIILPTVLAIALFVAAIWGLFLPTFERSLLERKREMIRELANSAWGVMADAYQAELRGEMTRDQAQRAAASRIESLRYGREGKDYFWVQDMTPRMIMHPYRRDLNGQDVSDFTDPRGTRIFIEFADMVRRQSGGYANYVWQWKDDPRRLEPKESYVKGFEPWGWIIGTGIYTDDVNDEIAHIERGLVWSSLAIVAVVGGLLFFAVRESLRLERECSDAEQRLAESHQRYRSLTSPRNQQS